MYILGYAEDHATLIDIFYLQNNKDLLGLLRAFR
jgi:hypothetical protein